MRILLPIALALLTLFCMQGASRAAVCSTTVPAGGDIQAAIDRANDGDMICLEPGVYTPASGITIPKPLTLTSSSPSSTAKPVIDGRGAIQTIIHIAADNVILDGLEVMNGTGDLIDSDAPSGVTGVAIRNCVVHNSHSPGDEGIQLKNCANCRIASCVIYDVAQDGICLQSAQNSSVEKCEISGSASENAALYVYYSSSITLECNTIHDTTAANGILLFKMGARGASYVRNNLVVDNAFAGRFSSNRNGAKDGNAITLYVPYDEPNIDAQLFVHHNTIDRNSGVGLGGGVTGQGIYWAQGTVPGAPVSIMDNLITRNRGWGILTEDLGGGDGAEGLNDYNDNWGNARGATSNAFTLFVEDIHNVSQDPLYNSDHTLSRVSPVKGAASDRTDMGVLFDDCLAVVVVPTQAPTALPHYIELEVRERNFFAGGILPLRWTVYPGTWGGGVVNVYLAAIYSPVCCDRPATVGETVSAGQIFIFRNGVTETVPYNPRNIPFAYKNVVFCSCSSSHGTVYFTVPKGSRGIWAFAAALVQSKGQFPDQAYPVEISNSFLIE
ncbi:MAG: right-handed parallel beta-helix repeat-containing protein [Candidatus Aureabacteria bacterium]|nr:right-handed parallel beta-helix repeat-containing protein [Candidatus Auribacterota bacterium]